MKQFFLDFKKYLVVYIVSIVLCLIAGTLAFVLYYVLSDMKYTFIGIINGFTISFGVLMGLGLFGYVARQGFFDLLIYGFKQVGSSIFNRREPNKFRDYVEYKDNVNVSRSSSPSVYMIMILTSLVFALALIIVLIYGSANHLYF